MAARVPPTMAVGGPSRRACGPRREQLMGEEGLERAEAGGSVLERNRLQVAHRSVKEERAHRLGVVPLSQLPGPGRKGRQWIIPIKLSNLRHRSPLPSSLQGQLGNRLSETLIGAALASSEAETGTCTAW